MVKGYVKRAIKIKKLPECLLIKENIVILHQEPKSISNYETLRREHSD